MGWARCKWGRGQEFEGTPLESHLFIYNRFSSFTVWVVTQQALAISAPYFFLVHRSPIKLYLLMIPPITGSI